MTAAVSLASLLSDHPFADDEPLLHGPDSMLTAGEARAAARARRRAAARISACGRATRSRCSCATVPPLITTMFGIWLAECGLRPGEPPRSRGRGRAGAGRDRARGARHRGRLRLARAGRLATYGPDTAFVMWTSGTTGEPKAILHEHSAYFELIDRVLGPLRAKPRDPAPPEPEPRARPGIFERSLRPTSSRSRCR